MTVLIFNIVIILFLPAGLSTLTVLYKKNNRGRRFSLREQFFFGLMFSLISFYDIESGVSIGTIPFNMSNIAVICAGIFACPLSTTVTAMTSILLKLSTSYIGGVQSNAIVPGIISILFTLVLSIWVSNKMYFIKEIHWLWGVITGAFSNAIYIASLAFFFHQQPNDDPNDQLVNALAISLLSCLSVIIAILSSNTLRSMQKKFSSTIEYQFMYKLALLMQSTFIITLAVINLVLQIYDRQKYAFGIFCVSAIIEIVISSTHFIFSRIFLKKDVINNIQAINSELNKITKGDLEVYIDVDSNSEFKSLSDGINKTVAQLKNCITDASSKIDKELEVASQIQLSSMPSVFPPFPYRREFDIYALMNPAREIGGDFYDFFFIKGDKLFFLIADVSGKGIPAAMFMMKAKTAIRGIAESGATPADILQEANNRLYENNDAAMFLTCWIGCLDVKTGVVTFANAGHNPPVLKRSNGECHCIEMDPGFVLAGLPDKKYVNEEFTLGKNDMVVLYTDGVTESTDKNDNFYGEERLKEMCCKETEVENLCKSIRSDIEFFASDCEQFDDITLLCLKYNN